MTDGKYTTIVDLDNEIMMKQMKKLLYFPE